MHVNVNFTLNINPDEWADRSGERPLYRKSDPDTEQRIADEVRAHAENVVRDLFADMGWTVEEANA